MKKLTRILSVIAILVVFYLGVQYFEEYKEKKAAELPAASELDNTQNAQLLDGEPAKGQDEPDEYFVVSAAEIGVQFWSHYDKETMEAAKKIMSLYPDSVYFDFRTEDNMFHCVSESVFRNIMESAPFRQYNEECGPGEFYSAESFETIKAAAVASIESFGPVAEKTTLKSFFTEERKPHIAYTTKPYYAFNDEMLAGEEINRDPVTELIRRGVQLEITNAETLQYVTSSEEQSISEWSVIYVHVAADVKCISNDGEFSSLAWIPAPGESRRTDFVVVYSCQNTELGHRIEFMTFDVLKGE